MRSAAGSNYYVLHGARKVKAYPVTRDELFGLGGAGVIATICFSVGGNYLNRSYDIGKDLELTVGVPPELKARWQSKEADYFTFGLIIFAIGVAAFIAGGVKVISIIMTTDHP
jgi:hypothetical protein